MAKGDTIVRCRANGAITSLLTTNLPDLVRPGSSAEPLENDGDLGARGLERLIFCAISFNGSPAGWFQLIEATHAWKRSAGVS